MKRIIFAALLAIFACVTASEISFAQVDHYVYAVVRKPPYGRPGWNCIQREERTINLGDLCGGRLRYGTTYCLQPGPLNCEPLVYQNYNLTAYPNVIATLANGGGILEGRNSWVTPAGSTAWGTWSFPANTAENDNQPGTILDYQVGP